MKSLNISLEDSCHERLVKIKEVLGVKNLNDALAEIIKRFKIPEKGINDAKN